ncbi:MAG: hypothetical protein Q9198_004224, partial [Flavoplaca austrocitrina]
MATSLLISPVPRAQHLLLPSRPASLIIDSKMDTKDEQVVSYVINDDANPLPMDTLDPTGVIVKPKWRGTPQDKRDMEVLGRHQVLR